MLASMLQFLVNTPLGLMLFFSMLATTGYIAYFTAEFIDKIWTKHR